MSAKFKFYPDAKPTDVATVLKAIKAIPKSPLKAPALPSRQEPAPRGFYCVLCGQAHGDNPYRCEALKSLVERAEKRALDGDNAAGTVEFSETEDE